MIQPKNITVNIGPLLDALASVGGMRKAAAKWRVDANSISMLFENKLPRLDALHRICAGARIKPSQIIVSLGQIEEPQQRGSRDNVIVLSERKAP